jgi:hypothetical protein
MGRQFSFSALTSGSLLQLLYETYNKSYLIAVHYSYSSLSSDILPISICFSLPSLKYIYNIYILTSIQKKVFSFCLMR